MKKIKAILIAAKKPGNLLLIALFLFTTFTCNYAQYRTKDTSSVVAGDNYAASTVDTFWIAKKGAATDTLFNNRFVTIVNEGTNDTDTLFVWFNNDSVHTKFYLLPRAVWNSSTLLKSVNTRSGGSGNIRRQIIIKGQ